MMTPDEAKTWIDEVNELGSSLFAGRELTREEFLELGNYYLSGKYLQHDLKIIRKKKEEARKGIEALEATEQRILLRMKKHNMEPEIE